MGKKVQFLQYSSTNTYRLLEFGGYNGNATQGQTYVPQFAGGSAHEWDTLINWTIEGSEMGDSGGATQDSTFYMPQNLKGNLVAMTIVASGTGGTTIEVTPYVCMPTYGGGRMTARAMGTTMVFDLEGGSTPKRNDLTITYPDIVGDEVIIIGVKVVTGVKGGSAFYINGSMILNY